MIAYVMHVYESSVKSTDVAEGQPVGLLMKLLLIQDG